MSMPVEIITSDQEIAGGSFQWRVGGAVRNLVCTPLEELGFANAFSTRQGGVSRMPSDALNLAGFTDDAAENIFENRRRFLSLFDGDWQLATAWQVHGATITPVERISTIEGDGGYTNDSIQCDALSTITQRILVGVKSADCVPVLLADKRTGACAAVHAGWRGTLKEILPRALDHLHEQYGTCAGDVHACLGPAAGGCCYEVGAEVINSFRERFERTFFTPTREGHARIDLHKANEAQLIQAGIIRSQIYTAPFCTMHNNQFFSYRREKNILGRVGRSLAVIGRQG